jgi:23S rRNA (uracil1939-C5)-methyltransferase
LTARRNGDGFSIGYSQKGSNQLVSLAACPVLTPALNDCLEKIHALLKIIAPKKGDVRITLLENENGIELALNISSKVREEDVRELTTHPEARHFIRLCINGETVLEIERPFIQVGSAKVTLPPEGFAQASKPAEEAMALLVTNHLAKAKRVADLFAGSGTFALRLAQTAQVYAAESHGPAITALDRAWRETGGKLKALTHEKRDLVRRPLNVKDLKPFDGVVFDPPRAGAEIQTRELAKSSVRKIAAVSCNPVTLARDIKILVDGGYKIISITPIDQFAFTPHLEAVVLLER